MKTIFTRHFRAAATGVAVLCAYGVGAQAQTTLTARNDTLYTGPLQTVRKDIVYNDVKSEGYSWTLLTSLNPATQGVAEQDGDYLTFTPAANFTGTPSADPEVRGTLDLDYELTNGVLSSTAKIHVIVREHNNPVNVIYPDAECVFLMSSGVAFEPVLKYVGKSGTTPYVDTDRLDGFSMPLVGDLNGDYRPEIVAMGMSNGTGTTAQLPGLSGTGDKIIILNGQTGEELYRYPLSNLAGSYTLRYEPRHNSVSKLAIADLDRNGFGEIIVTETGSGGRVHCIEPIFSGATITGMTKRWTGWTGNTSTVASYKSGISGTPGETTFGAPVPYIADLNADGTPEVIVYNKIYDGVTGELVCTLETLNNFSYTTLSTTAATIRTNYAYVGRRPSAGYSDDHIPCMAIADIDKDGYLDIVAGSKVYLMTNNAGKPALKSIILGPASVTAQRGTGSSETTVYVNDGFTAVADIDLDGNPDVIVLAPAVTGMSASTTHQVLYVWDPMNDPTTAKAATYLYTDGQTGTMSYPFVGDINGRPDDHTESKYLPEICFNGGRFYLSNTNCSQIAFHPLSQTDLAAVPTGQASSGFSAASNDASVRGHIIGFTYHNPAGTPLHQRLKLAWAMEHNDESTCTGITMFDFDNDGIKELCYRDENSVRVISPARKTYIYNTEGPSPTGAVRFKYTGTIGSYTGFEAPVIADVNLDGSADIVTLVHDDPRSNYHHSKGFVHVFEHASGSDKWAPCPPVWNQGIYFPLQINEDLTVPPKPQSMLKSYSDGTRTIYPYNGQWIQQPIVKLDADYVPQVRQPDAEITEMEVRVINASQMEVTLYLRNNGSASVNAQTPVTFYDGGGDGKSFAQAHAYPIGTAPVGVDIFPDESAKVSLLVNTTLGFNERLVWARITDDGGAFPAAGYTDCDPDNNVFSGSYCQDLGVELTVSPDSVLCSTTDNALLTAEVGGIPGAITYQWYCNGFQVPDSVSRTYHASVAGEYRCYVTVGPVCRGFTPKRKITREMPVAVDDTLRTMINSTLTEDIMRNDLKSQWCNPAPDILTQPLHGTASIVNDSLRYIPNSGFVGQDSLSYSIGNNTAKVRIVVYSRPDNLVDEGDCFVEGTSFAFSMRKQPWANTALTHANTGPLVGDLDRDGLPEIVAYNWSTGHQLDSLMVYNGQTGALKARISLDSSSYADGGWFPVMTAALADADRNGRGEIIFTTPTKDRKVRSFEVTGSGSFSMAEKWTSAEPFDCPTPAHAAMPDRLPQPIVADFNGDSVPEVVIYNKIYNAATGAYLGYTESSVMTAHVGRITNRNYNRSTNFMTAADFDGDGLPEIAAGGKVYKVRFNAAKTSVTCTKWSEHASVADGYTAVADVNLDGHLDVVVVNGVNPTYIQIWTPATKTKFTDIQVTSTGSQGYPFIGDIDGVVTDGKKYPEICVVTSISTGGNVTAFKFNPVGGTFSRKWEFQNSDSSGGTGITLFDFNNDGINEVVYRDQGTLYVLNGTADGAKPTTQASYACTSGTAFEYPVIADTDGDGSANICVTCNNTVTVFESNNATPWSTTRKVWNQVNYEPLQISEDLTVPPFVLPKNRTFGTKQPYNGALIQVPTMVNTDFDVVQISPDPAVDSVWITPVNASTSRVWVRIKNLGVKNTNIALPVALYNTGTPGTGFLQQKQVGAILAPGDTYDLYFEIPTSGVTIIMSVRIQDTGTQFPAAGSFLDCNLGNNTGTVSGLLAVNDYVYPSPDRPSRIDVRDNDYLSSCGRGQLTGFVVVKQPTRGTLASGSDSVFT
ncbi:MAG: hypothetical protein LBP98_08565, partial [Tannerella sp.]|nr:hypothetical protein [Tannerella sp.]